MAVIVTGIKMPPFCGGCEYDYCNNKVYEEGHRPEACPMKSVDGLIAEIYDKFMTVDGGLHDKTASKCIEIIREYCGEGNE